MGTGSKKVVFIALGVLVFSLVGAGFYFLGSRNPQATPSPTSTPSQTSSVETQTPSPVPSGTPTATPKPTPTKTPTPSPTPALQTLTITSTASLDGWRASNNGGNNSWYIEVGRNATLTSRGYVSFDLSSLPSGANIAEAKLRMYQAVVVGTPYSGNSLIVDHIDYGDSLGSEDYALTPISSAIGTLTSNPTTEWKDLTVTSQVAADRSSSRSRSQFRLKFTTETTGADAWARFESGDNYLGTGNLPQLVIKYY